MTKVIGKRTDYGFHTGELNKSNVSKKAFRARNVFFYY